MRCVRKWSKADLEPVLASHTVAEALGTAVAALTPNRDGGGGTQSVSVSEPDCQGAPQPFAPPEGKFARPGATQVLSSGMVAHFFPKMPCLRCGCPWWSTDDWDGRCIRCGWDCEAQGYDDDSQPRAAHRARWSQLVALIQRGITPVWSGQKQGGE
ncbi:hypothetical protein H632_c190p1 [Helicosporidium sp. ATCC 50920]|nr:hypothetical protein H632_c190p1 [Helicosporidium sp. ATCC 50920]|eukprot:KDD76538.1 hypothetical protein H632_c190p1 [Helicosporidium sp. ATCC 50920]